MSRRRISGINFAAAVVAASQVLNKRVNAVSYELVTDMELHNEWRIIFSDSIWMQNGKEEEIKKWFRDNNIVEWFMTGPNVYVEDELTAMMVFMRFS